ncbi:MAG: ribosomal RNA small subunit methyltransferase A [Deltaproteobacteria bacterium]|nr:ribosomal RNA small subunit methyltransferase A [Deltaproteobacteria bacterium]
MRPKKRLGQHFLIDKNVVRKIISAASIEKGDCVIEVGPGTGVLTEALLEKGASVVAIEIDRELCRKLRERFEGAENLELMEGDALKKDFTSLSRRRGKKFKVVSNLPYNISGPILVKFMEERGAFSALTLMLQKEVAVRLVALPSTKDYGILSVFARAYAIVRREFDVSPNSFRPRPRVVSTVVSLDMLPKALVRPEDEGFFKKVVKSAFGKRRKTLFNALKSLNISNADMARALSLSGIDPERRGETLSVEEFIRLTEGFLFPAP